MLLFCSHWLALRTPFLASRMRGGPVRGTPHGGHQLSSCFYEQEASFHCCTQGSTRQGQRRGHTPRAAGKAAWEQKAGGQAAYPSLSVSAGSPWIKAGGIAGSLSRKEPQTSFSSNSCVLQRRKLRLRAGEGCIQSMGSTSVTPRSPARVCGCFYFQIPLTRIPSNKVASFLIVRNDQEVDRWLAGA